MELRGRNYGKVLNAAGARGFFGEGYPYHKLWRLAGLSFEGSTFVSKTTTYLPRKGNMPLGEDGITPKELLPKCIKVKLFKGVVLNSVGLSGPGAKALISTYEWQKRTEPFLISFMSVAATPKERLHELENFVDLMSLRRVGFKGPFGLEINFSCPNVGLHSEDLLKETQDALDTAGKLGIPLVLKLNVLVPPELACEIAAHSNCDAICCSNTIPWGQLPDKIDWKGLFGSKESPLKQFGGGGLSGAPLLPLVEEWLREARMRGLCKPIIAGGGIFCKADVDLLFDAGASAVSLGVIAMLSPWNMRSVIRQANKKK